MCIRVFPWDCPSLVKWHAYSTALQVYSIVLHLTRDSRNWQAVAMAMMTMMRIITPLYQALALVVHPVLSEGSFVTLAGITIALLFIRWWKIVERWPKVFHTLDSENSSQGEHMQS